MEQPILKQLGAGTLKASLWFEHGDESLSIRRFDVREAMNEPFTVDLTVVTANDDLDLEAFVGRPARFEIVAEKGRKLSGIVQSMTLERAEATGLSTYRLRIVPRLWLLTQRTNARIFQHLSLPDIVREVLTQARIEATYLLDDSAHPAHEYRVQYEETDFAFLSRLCEEAGIAFFFDNESKLTFADKPQTAPAREGAVQYFPVADLTAVGERFSVVELRDEVRPGRLAIRDHDFRRASDFELFGKHAVEHDVENELELYHYRPGASFIVTSGGGETPAADDRAVARAEVEEGGARAKRKLEAVRAGKLEVTLEGNTLDLAPGVSFRVARHPHRSLGEDRALLVVASTLTGDAGGEWKAALKAHFAAEPYRPPHRTKKPRIVGVQSAVVVGPSGDEIHCDEFGRVRVQFHWDRHGKRDEKSTCWMRVSQGWAGGGQGMIVLPRVGQEVFVGYLEGDPDRPIILGRTFNSTQPVPHALPANKTRSAWRSQTSPQNGGYNEIMMEDASGEEMLHMHAQKDLQKRVNNNQDSSIGNSLTENIANNKQKTVGTDEIVGIGQNFMKTVGQMYQLTVPPPPATPGAKSLSAAAVASDGKSAAPTKSDAGSGGDSTHFRMKYDSIELSSAGSITIRAGGEVRIYGSVIHLNP